MDPPARKFKTIYLSFQICLVPETSPKSTRLITKSQVHPPEFNFRRGSRNKDRVAEFPEI